jgi:hypothetical protein
MAVAAETQHGVQRAERVHGDNKHQVEASVHCVSAGMPLLPTLTVEDRVAIDLRRKGGWDVRAIARELGRS